MPQRDRRPGLQAIALLLVLLCVSACTAIRRVMDFQDQAAVAKAKVRIFGTIETEGAVEGVLVVITATTAAVDESRGRRSSAGAGREFVGVDSYTRATPGTFLFFLDSGWYALGAYEDRNSNGLLDTGERVYRLSSAELVDLAPGDRYEADIRLVDAEVHQGPPVDILGIVEKDVREQGLFALWTFSQKGKVIDSLDEERFGAEQGTFGFWRPVDFLNEELAGIYFLERYDDDRTPVLFVHGALGYPKEFETLFEALDRERFQPWFYFYPSGSSLVGTSNHLAQMIRKLEMELDFDELAIVAHSMGGLVSLGAIRHYVEEVDRNDIPLLITISSPLGGDAKAERAEKRPIELPKSINDLNPEGDYMKWLFGQDEEQRIDKGLAAETEHHMMIGFGGSGEPYNDGVVSVASQAPPGSQERAASIRIWDESHRSILEAARTADRLNRILDEHF